MLRRQKQILEEHITKMEDQEKRRAKDMIEASEGDDDVRKASICQSLLRMRALRREMRQLKVTLGLSPAFETPWTSEDPNGVYEWEYLPPSID